MIKNSVSRLLRQAASPGRESRSRQLGQDLDLSTRHTRLLNGFPILYTPESFLKTERREHLFIESSVVFMINVQHIDAVKHVVLDVVDVLE